MNNNTTLDSIIESRLIFLSAQPDDIYFHWQVELYLYQFSKHGILDNCYALFGYSQQNPSPGLIELSKKYPKNIIWYKDERNRNVENFYIPSIKPHLIKKFLRQYPSLGNNVFIHDSDILLVKLPKIELFLNDSVGYLSDTISYIGYDYIIECCNRYKEKYPELPEDDLFFKMCECIEIDPEIVKKNQKNSGGAQYLLKDIDAEYMEEFEDKCYKLYDLFIEYDKKYPIQHPIQKWTAEMWAILWVYWKIGKETRIHDEMDFSWATSTIKEFEQKNIFHCAGITHDNCSDKFYKGKFININIFDEYEKDSTIFDNVSPTTATYGYISCIKECYQNRNRPI
jgi:hypothetical protein